MNNLPNSIYYDLSSFSYRFPSMLKWKIDISRVALLVHDMQKYFLAPFDHNFKKQLSKHIQTLIQWADINGIPIIYTAQPGGMNRNQRGLLYDLWGSGMRRRSEEVNIIDELEPKPTDQVLTKWRYSAFFNTKLIDVLREKERKQLVICGVYGNLGILSTAIDAYSFDIQNFLVSDAIGDFSSKKHMSILKYASESCSVITSTKEICQL